jgi:hypothetical protein
MRVCKLSLKLTSETLYASRISDDRANAACKVEAVLVENRIAEIKQNGARSQGLGIHQKVSR